MSEIKFIYFAGCPKASAMWFNLLAATAKMPDLKLDIEKIDTAKDGVDASFKKWGSPAILFDGSDIVNYQPQSQDCDGEHCRYYEGEDDGILSAKLIEELILNRI
jgi:hypothetical protein